MLSKPSLPAAAQLPRTIIDAKRQQYGKGSLGVIVNGLKHMIGESIAEVPLIFVGRSN
jgi:hypothetical protein